MVDTYKTRGVVFQRNERNCCCIKRTTGKTFIESSVNSFADHRRIICSYTISEHGSRNSSKVQFKITFSSADNCSTKFGVLTTISDWLSRRIHQHRKNPHSSLHEHSLTMPPGIRPSILRSTAFYILFIELPKYKFSDPYQKVIHRSIHRTLQKINSSKHFFRTSIHQSFQKFLSSILFDYPLIDPSWTIYPEDHSSTHPEDALIDPYRRLIHSYHDPTDTPSNPVYRWTIGSPESDYIRGVNRHKVELNNIIFHNTKKKCNDIRSYLSNV